MIKLLIFDLDGTLVNAYPAIIKSVNFTLKKLGMPSQRAGVIKRAVGMGDRNLVEQFVGPELADRAVKIYRSHHLKALSGGVRFLPGAKKVLQWAKEQGLLVAIASNRPTLFTNVIIKKLKGQEYLDKVLCADRAPRPKPYPDMLLLICRALKTKKQDTFFVGDMTIDLKCGAKAGIRTIAVATGSNEKNELKVWKPYKIIDRLSKLKTIIKESS